MNKTVPGKSSVHREASDKASTHKAAPHGKLSSIIKMVAITIILIAFSGKYMSENNNDEFDLEYISKNDFAMGTAVRVDLYGENVDALLAENIINEIKILDAEIISWRNDTSEVGRLNSGYKVNEEYEISDTLGEIISESLDVCQNTDGALDITLRPVLDLWDLENASGEDFVIPAEMEIIEALSEIGYNNVEIFLENADNNVDDEYQCGLELTERETPNNNGKVIIGAENITLDFGATGKGYALDVAREQIIESDISGALITIGGSVLVYGSKTGAGKSGSGQEADGTFGSGKTDAGKSGNRQEATADSNWKIGVRNPKGEIDEMMGYISLSPNANVCISTSGNYEKYVDYEGTRYHHIIDPRTGHPVFNELASVTVVCESGIISDALSTACYVLGYEKSLAVLEMYNAEAIFISNGNEVTVTDGLRNQFIHSN